MEIQYNIWRVRLAFQRRACAFISWHADKGDSK